MCLQCDSACAEYVKKLSDAEHIARGKSSTRLALKGILTKIRVIAIKVDLHLSVNQQHSTIVSFCWVMIKSCQIFLQRLIKGDIQIILLFIYLISLDRMKYDSCMYLVMCSYIV